MGERNDVRNRLFKVIYDFSGAELEPLPNLEQWEYAPTEKHEPDPLNKRKNPRKDVPVHGIFETKYVKFRASSKNISVGGILINPKITLPLNEFINMTLVHRKLNVPVQTNGRVVRVDAEGTGIQFNKAVPVMASL